jgi:LPPG:FO 2-phospho-L-lactate transferase
MSEKIVVLAGGVGGAKMAEGFYKTLSAGQLSVIVNTADDFDHYGMRICPDIDTVCYTLGELSNPFTGWGRKEETWQVLESLSLLGGEDWFMLGDKDIATHLERTRRLKNGESLSEIIDYFCEKWNINAKIFPMSNQQVSTIVDSSEGKLSFQQYFVAKKCEPKVNSFHFEGIEKAKLSEGIVNTIREADLVVIAPSNPWVSIDPILNVGSMRDQLKKKTVIAISPIIGGKAIKGPAAKMYKELGMTPSAVSVFEHFQDIINGFVIDEIDRGLSENISTPLLITQSIMKNSDDKIRLANEIISFFQQKLH